MIFKKVLFQLLLLILVSSCASKAVGDKTPAEILYKDAEQQVKKERYILATEKLNTLKSQYPYSFYAVHADLLLADIHYLQENYIEAAASYLTFKELHPKHERISYVTWRLAESFYNQLPTTYDRDLSQSKEAIKYYQEILTKFPKSEYENQASEKIKKISEMLVNQDLYIADFYFKTDVYDSAKYRYLDILTKYKDPKIQEYGMIKVVKSSYLLNDYSECLRFADEYLNSVSEQTKSEIASIRKDCQKREEMIKLKASAAN